MRIEKNVQTFSEWSGVCVHEQRITSHPLCLHWDRRSSCVVRPRWLVINLVRVCYVWTNGVRDESCRLQCWPDETEEIGREDFGIKQSTPPVCWLHFLFIAVGIASVFMGCMHKFYSSSMSALRREKKTWLAKFRLTLKMHSVSRLNTFNSWHFDNERL